MQTRGHRPGFQVPASLLLVTTAALSGCTVMEPARPGEPIAEEPARRVVSTPVSDVLQFARWVDTATAAELGDARSSLEQAVLERADIESALRLSLLLNEPRTPGADPQRARQLLIQSLAQSPSGDPGDVRNLARLLIGEWDRRARLGEALVTAQEQAEQARGALLGERQRRVLAEKRLEALIEVERRLQRTGDAATDVKPLPK